jgi:hypothetical protein
MKELDQAPGEKFQIRGKSVRTSERVRLGQTVTLVLDKDDKGGPRTRVDVTVTAAAR